MNGYAMGANNKIIETFCSKYKREHIIRQCYRECQFPFEIIINLLCDVFNVSKAEGAIIAKEIINKYNLDYYKGCPNKQHSKAVQMYNGMKRLLKFTLYNRNHYMNECKRYKAKIYKAQKEYSDLKKLYEYLHN